MSRRTTAWRPLDVERVCGCGTPRPLRLGALPVVGGRAHPQHRRSGAGRRWPDRSCRRRILPQDRRRWPARDRSPARRGAARLPVPRARPDASGNCRGALPRHARVEPHPVRHGELGGQPGAPRESVESVVRADRLRRGGRRRTHWLVCVLASGPLPFASGTASGNSPTFALPDTAIALPPATVTFRPALLRTI